MSGRCPFTKMHFEHILLMKYRILELPDGAISGKIMDSQILHYAQTYPTEIPTILAVV
jgi:hypothetical protein